MFGIEKIFDDVSEIVSDITDLELPKASNVLGLAKSAVEVGISSEELDITLEILKSFKED